MSKENQETISDIVSEMHYCAEKNSAWCCTTVEFETFADRIEAAWKRDVSELRECLKEAIREKCPFTRMSCKHGEPCEYACGTDKWRKAIDTTK